ncbi:(2Fe-2S)-binding protein [Paenibacillus peoriae]|uniref:(2Fe-2S)-binding protein n=1 Tax=Paenibacillus peoriae TaxID=59893 RepID=UPI00026C65EF|nr:(2Fe-2S)-binding protein [Paenibacillus peoriae]MEC0180088.1 (2Fe-2S)-binding protein [Paenibacillus peoriae]
MSKRAIGRGKTVGTEVQDKETLNGDTPNEGVLNGDARCGESRHADVRYAGNPYADSRGGSSGALGASSHLLVCRCEEVSLAQLEQACDMGADTVRQLKMATRVTMGACQGRVCRQLVETWFYSQYPAARREAELLSQRPPVRPVTFGQLAEGGSL